MIRDLYEELNQPSEPIFKKALKKRATPFTKADLVFLKADTARQVQAPILKLTGKIAAPFLFSELQADLIDFTAQAYGKYKYILLVQDVFSRLVFGIATMTKSSKHILDRFEDLAASIKEKHTEFEIRRITTDGGAEFNLFKKYNHHLKTSLRSLATLDNAIGSFKKSLVRDMRTQRTDGWPSRVDKVTKGMNALPKEYLYDNEPRDVPDDADLREKLREKNQEFSLLNHYEIEKRAQNVEAKGQFRVAVNRKTFHRGWQPNWSELIHRVREVSGDSVTDESGKTFKTKHVLPIQGSTDAPVRSIEMGTNLATTKRAKGILEDLKRQVIGRFGYGRETTIARIGTYVNSIPNARIMMKEARINMRTPIATFLRLYPESFVISGQDVSIRGRLRRLAVD